MLSLFQAPNIFILYGRINLRNEKTDQVNSSSNVRILHNENDRI